MTKLKTNLFLKNGSADKIYNVTLQSEGDGYIVFGENGRRGLSLKRQEKTAVPLSLEDATKIYEKLIKSKIKSGYSEGKMVLRLFKQPMILSQAV